VNEKQGLAIGGAGRPAVGAQPSCIDKSCFHRSAPHLVRSLDNAFELAPLIVLAHQVALGD
jgi:hypothetical protein